MVDETEFQELKERVKKLEEKVFSKAKQKIVEEPRFEGLNGGIRLIMKEEFLNEPKSLDEIFNELKRQGYHYPKKTLSSNLLMFFIKKWHLITRDKADKVWKYVVRK